MALRIIGLVAASELDYLSLLELFEEHQSTKEAKFFHPHPFTLAQIEWFKRYSGKDIYSVAYFNEQAVAYGILRGWDEGFAIPSLGLLVRQGFRGIGIGKLMMEYLHVSAQLKGAKTIRLKVYTDNKAARSMYEALGYRFSPSDKPEEVIGHIEF